MPKRTTTFQTMVRFVREHFAEPGVAVTESKPLYDAVLEEEREVDVVIEGTFDGESVTTSLEVIEHRRRADVTWVEGMIVKHRTLPTNRLVLVSKSGFSKLALKRVMKEGGWVEAVTPKTITVKGKPVVQSLYVDKLELRPTRCVLTVLGPDGQPLRVDVLADTTIFDHEAKEVGPAVQLAHDALNIEWFFEQFLRMAHGSPRRDELGGFQCGLPLAGLGYALHHEETGEYHPVLSIDISGEADFTQDEMAFTLAELGNRKYGAGDGMLMGKPAVWVASTHRKRKQTTVSWRQIDGKPLPLPETDAQRVFTRLGELQPPSVWAEGAPEESVDPSTVLTYMVARPSTETAHGE